MTEEYSSLEAVGAIVSGLGLVLMVVRGLLLVGLFIVLIGVLLWKEGESQRVQKAKLEEIERELEELREELGRIKG